MDPAQASQWKKDIQDGASSLFETKRGLKRQDTGADEEKPFSEIGQLKMELDWLKKSPG
uniref:Uncharacterized protein n=1 Tax=Candidatus Kentrum eta TaxID=2126337 RepID=A0A450VCP1_9GAMM|nr:MAG: hypothetical protein BECKH772B_GA0070898_102782 [Candidatus Kentron sp. H]VFK02534.1 MAG: hypothetical protein BECKH772A_GA0070896_102753 [Candidatus Kentron sp. H]VFK05471.1 MAG: hypothetical protein BECKH772C_GA0070978_102763 [Candidatus Kentron sp. H]